MKKFVLFFVMLFATRAMAAPKPPCPPYVWGAPTPINCVDISYPAPMGGTIDIVAWMTMNPLHRGKIAMEPGHEVNFVVNNKIIYTKFDDLGDYVDVWTFDEDYMYVYTTYGKIVPGKIRGDRAGSETDYPLLPRYAQLGMPGVVVVAEGGNFQEITDCGVGPLVPRTNTITELWGPFTLLEPAYLGNSGYNYVIMRSYWDCHGTDHNSCTQREDYWFIEPSVGYGWIKWTGYEAKGRDGNFVQVYGGDLWSPKPGTSALPDWCLSPPLFEAPRVVPPVHSWIPIPARRKNIEP